jgi:hypothetical protein
MAEMRRPVMKVKTKVKAGIGGYFGSGVGVGAIDQSNSPSVHQDIN